MMYHAPRPFKLDCERPSPPDPRPDSMPKPGGGSYHVTFGPEEHRLGIMLDQGGTDGFEVPHMVMVTEVDQGGNGYKHGLQPGDQILDINGVNLEALGDAERSVWPSKTERNQTLCRATRALTHPTPSHTLHPHPTPYSRQFGPRRPHQRPRGRSLANGVSASALDAPAATLARGSGRGGGGGGGGE